MLEKLGILTAPSIVMGRLVSSTPFTYSFYDPGMELPIEMAGPTKPRKCLAIK
jgi:hypothetical protein